MISRTDPLPSGGVTTALPGLEVTTRRRYSVPGEDACSVTTGVPVEDIGIEDREKIGADVTGTGVMIGN